MKDKNIGIEVIHEIGWRDNQEDYYGYTSVGDYQIYVVSDGMGGYEKGEVASRIIVETVLDKIKEGLNRVIKEREISIRAIIVNAVSHAYDEVNKIEGEKLGGTLVVAIWNRKQRKLWVGWVGDSRAYLAVKSDEDIEGDTAYKLYSRDGWTFYLLTEDHSFTWRHFESKGITMDTLDEFIYDPYKNQIDIAIMKGADKEEVLAYIERSVKEFRLPTTEAILILCTDGVWESFGSHRNFFELLIKRKSLEEFSKNLKNSIKRYQGNNQEGDNFTAIIVDLGSSLIEKPYGIGGKKPHFDGKKGKSRTAVGNVFVWIILLVLLLSMSVFFLWSRFGGGGGFGKLNLISGGSKGPVAIIPISGLTEAVKCFDKIKDVKENVYWDETLKAFVLSSLKDTFECKKESKKIKNKKIEKGRNKGKSKPSRDNSVAQGVGNCDRNMKIEVATCGQLLPCVNNIRSADTLEQILQRAKEIECVRLLEASIRRFWNLGKTNYKDKNGNTLVHYAVLTDDPELVSRSLKYENYQNKDKENPLHWAVKYGKVKAIKALKKKKEIFEKLKKEKDKNGKTPCDYAREDRIKKLVCDKKK